MQTQWIKVVRSFYINRELKKPGDELEVPRVMALELAASEKAKLIERKPQKNVDVKSMDADTKTKEAATKEPAAK